MSLPLGCEARCPGCAHRELTSHQSETQKSAWLKRRLATWADRLTDLRAPRPERRLGYRERSCLRAHWNAELKQWEFGLAVTPPGERKPQVVPIPGCPVHSSRVRGIFQALSHTLPGPESVPLVFVLINGEIVTLVLKTGRRELEAEFTTAVQSLSKWGVRGIWINFHASAGNRVLSSTGWQLIWGLPRAQSHGRESFNQQIEELWRDSIAEAHAFLSPDAQSAVLDLYCGMGVTLQYWIEAGAQALGVELGGESVEIAQARVPAATVLRGRVSERIPQMNQWLAERSSLQLLAYLNPPRLGLESEVAIWLTQVQPQRIGYLSCSAGTLARDLSILTEAGYRVERIIPYDFFPQTEHVETLAFLELDSTRSIHGALGARDFTRSDGR